MSTPKKPNRNCEVCGRPFAARIAQILRGAGRYCSQRCHGQARIGTKATPEHIAKARDARLATLRAGRWVPAAGPRNPNWKGGVTVSNQYRVLSSIVTRRAAGGQKYEHRAVMAAHLGRPLSSSEIVHHINGDKTDNPSRELGSDDARRA